MFRNSFEGRFQCKTMRVSAETLNRGWLGMDKWVQVVVGEWPVVTGCVVLPLFLGSLSL